MDGGARHGSQPFAAGSAVDARAHRRGLLYGGRGGMMLASAAGGFGTRNVRLTRVRLDDLSTGPGAVSRRGMRLCAARFISTRENRPAGHRDYRGTWLVPLRARGPRPPLSEDGLGGRTGPGALFGNPAGAPQYGGGGGWRLH